MDERRDYAVLISLSTREEAEVAASALRADGIDAFVGNAGHATNDWFITIALGGLQILVPRTRLADAKQALQQRIRESAENPEGEPVGRRDRWKLWLIVAYTVAPGFLAMAFWFFLAASGRFDPNRWPGPGLERPGGFDRSFNMNPY